MRCLALTDPKSLIWQITITNPLPESESLEKNCMLDPPEFLPNIEWGAALALLSTLYWNTLYPWTYFAICKPSLKPGHFFNTGFNVLASGKDLYFSWHLLQDCSICSPCWNQQLLCYRTQFPGLRRGSILQWASTTIFFPFVDFPGTDFQWKTNLFDQSNLP